jgi:hypothetical protein
MVIKSLFFVAGTVAALSTSYGTLKVAAPKLSAEIDTLLRSYVLGWSENACTNNPLGCLESRYSTLQTLEATAATSIIQMRSRLEQISGIADEQELVAEKNQAFLDKGKVLFKSHGLSPNQQIEFAGRTYPNLATFQNQLQLLFEEKSMIDTSVKSAKNLKQKLQEGLDALVVHRGRISLSKQMIPSQIELVRANQTLANFGTSLAMIDGVIRGSEGSIADSENLIRSTKELMETSAVDAAGVADPSKPSNDAFNHFLQQ